MFAWCIIALISIIFTFSYVNYKGLIKINYLAYHERRPRGTFAFPVDLHYIDPTHPRYQMPFHWHLEFELIFVLKGSFALTMDTETVQLNAGDCAIIPDGIIHGGIPNDCIYECIVLDINRFLEKGGIASAKLGQTDFGKLCGKRYFCKGDKVCRLIDELFAAMEKEQPNYEYIVTGLLWQIVGTISSLNSESTVLSHNQRQLDTVKRVLLRIRKDYDQPLTLNQLALEANRSPRYLCRAFSQIAGRTPIDYLNYYRIECAAEQLLVTDQTITDIALSCGFNDLSYFTRSFKRYKGMSPTSFKQQK